MENSEMKENNKKRRARRARLWAAALLFAAALLLLGSIYYVFADYTKQLRQSEHALKDDAGALLNCLREQDADGAERMTDRFEADIRETEWLLDEPIGRLAARSGLVQEELAVADKAFSVAKSASGELIRPYIALMRELPLSALRTEEGEIDLAAAERYIAFLEENKEELLRFSDSLREFNAMPAGRLESRLAGLREQTETLPELIAYAIEVTEELLRPSLELLRDTPLSQLKTEDGGLRIELVDRYLSFAEEKGPYARGCLEKLDTLGLEGFESFTAYREKADELLATYEDAMRYLPFIRAFLGHGEDRLYVFAAQNSSEIRASGGFPGAVGTIRIRDGVLRIEDFKPVNNVLYFNRPPEITITQQEAHIFGDWFYAPRDADFCPDFERVGEIWSVAYKVNNDYEEPDGVLSATPVIIQRILSAVGPVELSDGTVLDGTNAARELEYDMYYRFFSYGSDTDEGNELSDALFAETAKTVVEKAMGEISLKNAKELFSVLEQSAADRTLMFWMRDAGEQELVRAAGLNCSLNDDPAKPEAGIYFSLTNPSRMGWFLNMDPSMELLEEHEDGSKTYAVHLEMSNRMTEQEFLSASWYITGSITRGVVTGYLYLFAPAGGTIGEITCSDGTAFEAAEYRALGLRFTHGIVITPGSSLAIDYTLTTAPCEQEPLALSMTPTLQDYR